MKSWLRAILENLLITMEAHTIHKIPTEQAGLLHTARTSSSFLLTRLRGLSRVTVE